MPGIEPETFPLLETHSTIWAISVRYPNSHIPALYALAFHSILHTTLLKDEREITQTMENSAELIENFDRIILQP